MTPSVSIDSLKNATQEQIVKALFEQYLQHYKNPEAGDRYGLDDYTIQSVDVSMRWQQYARESSEFAASVMFSVKPSVFENSDWIAGNGETGDSGWIKNKLLIVRVLVQDGLYQLQILGTG